MTTPAAAKPALQGSIATWRDHRYRVYGAEHLPFDALPSYRDGGPAKVVRDGWSVSYTTDCGATIDGVRLSARKHPDEGEREEHPLHHTVYPTQEAASRAAYDAGLLGFFVYERDAEAYGL